MKHTLNRLINRRVILAAAIAAATAMAPGAFAQTKQVLRISTPAVPDDWHAKMWTVMKDELDKTAPGQFDTQINLNASLFKQGTEPAAMARGNLEMSSISAFDIAKIVPEFSIFTAGYVIRDPDHLMKVFNGPIGEELFKLVSEKMDITILSPIYLGTRQLNLRELKNVKTPADLKGVKLRMPGSKEWLFLGEALGVRPSGGPADAVGRSDADPVNRVGLSARWPEAYGLSGWRRWKSSISRGCGRASARMARRSTIPAAMSQSGN